MNIQPVVFRPIEEMSADEVLQTIELLKVVGPTTVVDKDGKPIRTPHEKAYLEALELVNLFGTTVGLKMVREKAIQSKIAQRKAATPTQIASAKQMAIAMTPEVQAVVADRDTAIGQLAWYRKTMEETVNALEYELKVVREFNASVSDQNAALIILNAELKAKLNVVPTPKTFLTKLTELFK